MLYPLFIEQGGHPILVSGEIIRQIDKQNDYTMNIREVY